MSSRVGSFVAELRRRKVVRVAIAYAGAAFVAWQTADILFPHLMSPRAADAAVTVVIATTVLGFPVAVLLAWMFRLGIEEPQAVGALTLRSRGAASESPSASSRAQESPGDALTSDISIAVLPFTNISPDAENEYFADGMTEEIIADLSGVRALRVISRTSAVRFKGTGEDLRSIARKLGVRYVLEGSVRKAGENLRITAQLIDARDDMHLWADKFSGTTSDIFDIQEKVSRAIVTALRVRLDPESERLLVARPVADIQAYDCYLRAREEIWRCTGESLGRALRLLRNGLAIMGENPVLHAAMGQAYWQYINMGISADPEYLTKAEVSAEKALSADPSSAMGNLLMGEIAWKRGHMEMAIKQMKAAVDSDPNNPDALLVLAYVFAFVGKSSAGRPLILRLLSIDPLTPLNYGVQAYLELFDGRLEAAVAPAQQMYELDSESGLTRWIYTVILGWNGRIDESPWNGHWAREADPKTLLEALCRFLNLALLGESDASRLMKGFEEAARWDEQYSWHMATCYSLLGRTDESLDWLRNAVARGFLNYPFLCVHDPLLEGVRSDPRFRLMMGELEDRWRRLEV